MQKAKVLLYLVVFLLVASSVSAQFINPSAMAETLNKPVKFIRALYSIEGYALDSGGRQAAVYNQQYKGARTIIDFFFVLLFVGLALRKNEYLKGLGKGAPVILSLIVAFVVAFMSQTGIISMFTPLVANMFFIVFLILFYFGMCTLFRIKKEDVGKKLFVFIFALAITLILFILLNNTGFGDRFTKVPGVRSTGATDLPVSRIIKGGAVPIDELYGKTESEKAIYYFTEAEIKLNEALGLFNEGKFTEAKTAITDAKSLNREGYEFVK